jgi:predicted transcriptional regulator
MNDLYNRLSVLKIILNSSYGANTAANVYEESYKIRKKISTIKERKKKIKNLFNV